MKVLVTGAAGFIGARLSMELLMRGYDVLGVDSLTDYYSPAIKVARLQRLRTFGHFTHSAKDLLRDDLVNDLDGVEAVFHLAGQPGVRTSWRTGFDDHVARNVTATHRLLEAAVGKSISRFVYSSSSSVYGNQKEYPTAESAPKLPFSPYGVTKLAAENLCAVYAANFEVPILSLRYFTVFGGGQRPDMAIQRMIECGLDHQPFPLFGEGDQRRDFTHVSDVVEANIAALQAPIEAGDALNIAGGASATVSDLIDLVSDAVGAPVKLDRRGGQRGDVDRTEADTARARQLLDWAPKVSLLDGVAEQVDWVRAERDR